MLPARCQKAKRAEHFRLHDVFSMRGSTCSGFPLCSCVSLPLCPGNSKHEGLRLCPGSSHSCLTCWHVPSHCSISDDNHACTCLRADPGPSSTHAYIPCRRTVENARLRVTCVPPLSDLTCQPQPHAHAASFLARGCASCMCAHVYTRARRALCVLRMHT